MIERKLETVVGAVEATVKEAVGAEQKKLKERILGQKSDLDEFIEKVDKEFKQIDAYLRKFPDIRALLDDEEPHVEEKAPQRRSILSPRKMAANDRPGKRPRSPSEVGEAGPNSSKYGSHQRLERQPSRCPWCDSLKCENLIECGWKLSYKERSRIQDRLNLCNTCLKPHGGICRKQQMRCTYCEDKHHVLICPFIGREEDEARQQMAKNEKAIQKALNRKWSGK